jgi:transcriptional regulator of acetoin/glycerol metabolism
MVEFRLKAWDSFINDQELVEGINPDIAASWERCRNYGVDYNDGIGAQLEPKRIEKLLEENKQLLDIARPIMTNLHDLVIGSHFALLLTDRNGYILERFGDDVVKDRACKIRFNLGSLWTEEAVGTNAIGTSLAMDRPIQVIGAEHYCATHHDWVCAATTIHGINGEVVGCLNMSGYHTDAHSHTLGIVVAAAYTIERQLELIHSYNLMEKTFESTQDGLIIVDADFHIQRINEGAKALLCMAGNPQESLDIRRIFRSIDWERPNVKTGAYFTEMPLHVGEKRIICSVTVSGLLMNDSLYGYSIGFREATHLHKAVNKVTGNVATYTFDSILTVTDSMRDVIKLGKKIASFNSCVLIEGESGTGKELFAHAIHNASPRRSGPFIAVNCASIPRELVESELFGYEKGAFTGALKGGNPGKFELADGGTIFLDEIGEMPLEVQAKVLRVVETLTVRRIGSQYEKKLDVRIIAATNRNLAQEVQDKNFREDLYFRLNVLRLTIPPLRERPRDVDFCADHFLWRLNRDHLNAPKTFSAEFERVLRAHSWPGNVRELQNAVERAYFLSENAVIEPDSFPQNVRTTFVPAAQKPSAISVDDLVKRNLEEAIVAEEGNVAAAAERLNMSRASLYRKIKKHDIDLSGLSHRIN